MIATTTLSKADVAYRFLGQNRTVVAESADRRPEPGEILTCENVLVETATPESEEELPVGDCRCRKNAARRACQRNDPTKVARPATVTTWRPARGAGQGLRSAPPDLAHGECAELLHEVDTKRD